MTEVLELPKLLSELDAAKRLNFSVFTLMRERKAGHIAYRRIRGSVRYIDSDLAAYIDSSKVSSCPGIATNSGGAGLGSITSFDRRAAHLLAQKTLKPRSSS